MIIRRIWSQIRISQRKCSKGQAATPATFGPSISPVNAVTVGPVVVGSGSFYRHIQATAATLWSVAHNLGKRPNVDVTSVGGLKVADPEVNHTSNNNLTIIFDIAFAGEAHCN